MALSTCVRRAGSERSQGGTPRFPDPGQTDLGSPGLRLIFPGTCFSPLQDGDSDTALAGPSQSLGTVRV